MKKRKRGINKKERKKVKWRNNIKIRKTYTSIIEGRPHKHAEIKINVFIALNFYYSL